VQQNNTNIKTPLNPFNLRATKLSTQKNIYKIKRSARTRPISVIRVQNTNQTNPFNPFNLRATKLSTQKNIYKIKRSAKTRPIRTIRVLSKIQTKKIREHSLNQPHPRSKYKPNKSFQSF